MYSENQNFSALLADIRQYPVLAHKEQIRLFYKYRDGNQDAFDLLVSSNLRLILKLVLPKASSAQQALERFSAGTIGLITSVEKFDPDLGFTFATYASQRILQAVQYHYSYTRTLIYVPQRVIENRKSLLRVREVFKRKYSRYPTNLELSDESQLSIDEVDFLLNDTSTPLSLEAPFMASSSDTETTSFHDVLSGPSVNPENAAIHSSNLIVIDNFLSRLKPQEREILERHYGLQNATPETLADIGRTMSLSRERVRQIRQKSLQSLRKYLSHYTTLRELDALV